MVTSLTVLAAQAVQAHRGWLAENATLVVGIVGIVVSGVAGPAVAAYFTAARERSKDKRALIAARRDDLRAVVDDTARSLSGAVRALRPLLAADLTGGELPAGPAESLNEMIALGQRLRLRLPEGHPVVDAYDDAREKLEALSKALGSQAQFEEATRQFDTSRGEFLKQARETLQAPVDESKEL